MTNVQIDLLRILRTGVWLFSHRSGWTVADGSRLWTGITVDTMTGVGWIERCGLKDGERRISREGRLALEERQP